MFVYLGKLNASYTKELFDLFLKCHFWNKSDTFFCVRVNVKFQMLFHSPSLLPPQIKQII